MRGNIHPYVAVIEATDFPTRNIARGSIQNSDQRDDDLMFVMVGEIGQDRQGMFRSQLPVVIWLQALNGLSNPIVKLFRSLSEFYATSLVPFLEDREGHILPGHVSFQAGKRPCEMVEATSQVVNNVSDNDSPCSRRRAMKPDVIDVVSLLRDYISCAGIGFSVRECINFPFEFFEVFVRPIQFQESVFQRVVHELCSKMVYTPDAALGERSKPSMVLLPHNLDLDGLMNTLMHIPFAGKS